MLKSPAMNIPILFASVFAVLLAEISCGPVEKIDNSGDDLDFKLLKKILPPNGLGHVVEDTSLEANQNNFISSHLPFYKSNYKPGYDPDRFNFPRRFEYYSKNALGKNDRGMAATNKEDSLEPGKNVNVASLDAFDKENKRGQYEVREDQEEDFASYHHHRHDHPLFFTGHDHGFEHKHGSYTGFRPYYHHHHHFHHDHSADCFPHRNGRRPRPPQPPTTPTTSTASPSIDPRASTSAGIISTETPRIDIRVGRDTRQKAESTDFLEEGVVS